MTIEERLSFLQEWLDTIRNLTKNLIENNKKIERRLIPLEEMYKDIDRRLTKMEEGYQEQIDSINTQGEMISDLNAELSELQVKWQTRGEEI